MEMEEKGGRLDPGGLRCGRADETRSREAESWTDGFISERLSVSEGGDIERQGQGERERGGLQG